MTQLSRPWNGTTTGDATEAPYDAPTEFADILMAMTGAARMVNKGGVFRSALNGLTVSNGGANLAAISTGEAQVYGTWYRNDAAATLSIPTPAGSTRIDRVVLRKDWSAQTVRLTRIAGIEGSGTPAMTQNAGVTWDVPLASVSITTGGVMTFTDQREYVAPMVSSSDLSGTLPYSALVLTGSIVNADINSAAAIASSKLDSDVMKLATQQTMTTRKDLSIPAGHSTSPTVMYSETITNAAHTRRLNTITGIGTSPTKICDAPGTTSRIRIAGRNAADVNQNFDDVISTGFGTAYSIAVVSSTSTGNTPAASRAYTKNGADGSIQLAMGSGTYQCTVMQDDLGVF